MVLLLGGCGSIAIFDDPRTLTTELPPITYTAILYEW
jgi:hypothetical protein